MRRFVHCSLIFCCISLSNNQGIAQEFYGGGVSAQTAAQAGIYVPSSDNVLDALALNPAGLAELSAPTLNLTATGIFARGSFSNAANVDSPMRRNNGLIPFGAFGMPLGHSRWTVAAGFMPDLLSSSKWGYSDTPGVAGANYGAQLEKSAILAFRSSAGVSYAITKNISVGATVGAVYNSNTLVAPYIFQSQPVLKGLKTLLDLHTNGTGWDTSFGLRAKLSKRLSVGAAYQTSDSITSSGNATGNVNAQFAALGVNADPTFSYRAQVKVRLPQSALASASWSINPGLRLNLQGNWVGWHRSFRDLPVSLTGGTNTVLNSLVAGNSLNDTVPLQWKDQFTIRAGFEKNLGERFSISGGYLHGNNPVPASTLSPLTAAIMQDGFATGIGYLGSRYRIDLSYGIDLTAHSQVGTSSLLSGEYSNSKVGIGTQGITLSMAFHL
jgi:long-chain fatty acid transport protein